MMNHNQQQYNQITNSYSFNVLQYDNVFLNNDSLQKDQQTGQINVVEDQLIIWPRHIHNENPDEIIETNYKVLLKFQNGVVDKIDQYGHHHEDHYNNFSKITPQFINQLYNDYEETDIIADDMVLCKKEGVIKFHTFQSGYSKQEVDDLLLLYRFIVDQDNIDNQINQSIDILRTYLLETYTKSDDLTTLLNLKANLQYVLDNYYQKTYSDDTYYTKAQSIIDQTGFYTMLTTYYDTRSVANNTYVSKGQLSPYLTGTILTTKFNLYILKTDLSLYNTNALLTTKFGLYILKTDLTYNTNTLLLNFINANNTLTNYYTKTQSDGQYLGTSVNTLLYYYLKTETDAKYSLLSNTNTNLQNLNVFFTQNQITSTYSTTNTINGQLNLKVDTSSFRTYNNDAALQTQFDLYVLISDIPNYNTDLKINNKFALYPTLIYLGNNYYNMTSIDYYFSLRPSLSYLAANYRLKSDEDIINNQKLNSSDISLYNSNALLTNKFNNYCLLSSYVSFPNDAAILAVNSLTNYYNKTASDLRYNLAVTYFNYSNASLQYILPIHIDPNYYILQGSSSIAQVYKPNFYVTDSTSGGVMDKILIYHSGQSFYQNTGNHYYNAALHQFNNYPVVTNQNISFDIGANPQITCKSTNLLGYTLLYSQSSQNIYWDVNYTTLPSFFIVIRRSGTNANGLQSSTNLWVNISDEKSKKEIKKYNNDYHQKNVNEFLQIEFCKYKYNESTNQTQSTFGILAQQVQSINQDDGYFNNTICDFKDDQNPDQLGFNNVLFLNKAIAILQEELRQQKLINIKQQQQIDMILQKLLL